MSNPSVSRIALRVGALLVAGAALLPRGIADHERVLVLGLEGASLPLLQRLVAAGHLPTLKKLTDGELTTSLRGSLAFDRPGLWNALLNGVSPGQAHRTSAGSIWDEVRAHGGPVVVVGVPGMDFRHDPGVTVLPGSMPLFGFIGDDTGLVSRPEALRGQDVAWPYESAARTVAEWVHELGPGGVSAWIGISDGAGNRKGIFRIYVLDSDVAYLTPVYARTVDPSEISTSAGESLYVADDPSSSILDEPVKQILARHVNDLARDRAGAAATLAQGRWRLMIYVDTAVSTLHQLYTGEDLVAPREDLVRAYVDLDDRLATVIEATGPKTAVVLLGMEPQIPNRSHTEALREPIGWVVVAPTRTVDVSAGTSIDRVASTLRYLLGLHDDEESIPSVRARYWTGSSPRLATPSGVSAGETAFDVGALQTLELLSIDGHASPAAPREAWGESQDAAASSSR